MNLQSRSDSRTCASCGCFRTAPLSPDMGTCRANPPQGVMIPVGNQGLAVQGFWPPTPPGEWCAKWQPIPISEGSAQAN